ncbi:limbic system-associated membrane protein-like [Ptychodera flava]|uniref:limbic system-associated membrane protein-like n=1 Tax=Ptychodera flava TaxID=63121 RepID=UPI00396A84D6
MSCRFYPTLCACMCFLGIVPGQSESAFTEIPTDTLSYRGCSAQLNCSISDLGDTISWYAKVDGDYQQISSGHDTYNKHFKVIRGHLMGEFHLFIYSVERSDETVYKCTANQTGVSKVARLFVLDQERGPFCNVTGTSVIENLDSVNFTCWVDLPDDVPGKLVWRNNGKEVARTQKKTNDYMKRVFDRSEDGDEYTCVFEYHNAYFCHEMQSLSCREVFIINVQYSPEISLLVANDAVIEGSTYSRVCSVESNPEATVEWLYEEIIFTASNTLTLANVRRDQQGTYKCRARNTFRQRERRTSSKSFVLNVQYKPSVERSKFRDKVKAEISAKASLVCVVSANPAPTFTWHKDGELVDGSSEETTEGTETTSTLTLYFVSNADYGEYVSTARNNVGEDQCKITMVRKGLFPGGKHMF